MHLAMAAVPAEFWCSHWLVQCMPSLPTGRVGNRRQTSPSRNGVKGSLKTCERNEYIRKLVAPSEMTFTIIIRTITEKQDNIRITSISSNNSQPRSIQSSTQHQQQKHQQQHNVLLQQHLFSSPELILLPQQHRLSEDCHEGAPQLGAGRLRGSLRSRMAATDPEAGFGDRRRSRG
jgi:hypothetical protein